MDDPDTTRQNGAEREISLWMSPRNCPFLVRLKRGAGTEAASRTAGTSLVVDQRLCDRPSLSRPVGSVLPLIKAVPTACSETSDGELIRRFGQRLAVLAEELEARFGSRRAR